MQRKLQSFMLLIVMRQRFCQLFTALVWYRPLLLRLPCNLLEIPWARTDSRHDQLIGSVDKHKKVYQQ